MSFLDLLKPAPHAEKIEDDASIEKNYKYWRWRIFYGMYVGYVFYYLTRKSFTFAMPAMIADLGYSKSDLGILGSTLSIAYGCSKFLSGMLADRSNPRYFMSIGLILTGIFNILFGLSSSLFFFTLFWGLNGWFQGWGWPPCARLLTHWYSQKERGSWWGLWNTSHSLGGFLTPFIAAYCSQYCGWRFGMYIPGALCIFGGLFLMNRLRDTPQSLGLPPVENFKNDHPPLMEAEKELSVKELFWNHVFNNKYIWILASVYFFVYVIRTAVNDWSLLFLVEAKGYTQIKAAACVSMFEVGGICGSLVSGWMSDRIFMGKRAPVMVIFSLGVIFSILGLWSSSPGAYILDSISLFMSGFFIFGPQMLAGMAAAELSHKKAAGTSTGFIGWIANIGAACAGYPVGKMIQSLGWWQGFFLLLIGSGCLSCLLLLPLWKVKHNPKYALSK